MPGAALQHDNAEPHAACHTTHSLANNNVQLLPWPSTSLNPNNNSWNELERRVRGRANAPANVRELFQALRQERVAIPTPVVRNLIQSMPERCGQFLILEEDPSPHPLLMCVSLRGKNRLRLTGRLDPRGN